MDPNILLANIRELTAKVIYIRRHGGQPPLDLSEDLAHAMKDMDEWLSKGGFLPTAWAFNDTPLVEEEENFPGLR